MELKQQKNVSTVKKQKKGRDNHSEQSSEQSILIESIEDSIVIDENEEYGSSSASHGISSSIIKENTTTTSDTINVLNMPDSEDDTEHQYLYENEKIYDLEEDEDVYDLEEKEYIDEDIYNLEDLFKDGEEFYSFKEDDDIPELYLDADVKGNTQESDTNDTLNAEANGQDEQDIDEDLGEEQKQTQNQSKDKKKEVTVPWGLGATLGLEAIAPVILGGTLGPAAILMAILWLSHKSFKLPVTEKAKQFKDKHHKKRETNTTDNSQKANPYNNKENEEEFNIGTTSIEEQKKFMEVVNENKEAFNKTLIDLFKENKETFEKAFEDMKDIEGINEIENYKELLKIINEVNEFIEDDSKTPEEKEEKVQEFINISDMFINNLEENKEIMNKLNEKFNEKEEPIKTSNLFSAFKIIKDAKKIDGQIRGTINDGPTKSFVEIERERRSSSSNEKSSIQRNSSFPD